MLNGLNMQLKVQAQNTGSVGSVMRFRTVLVLWGSLGFSGVLWDFLGFSRVLVLLGLVTVRTRAVLHGVSSPPKSAVHSGCEALMGRQLPQQLDQVKTYPEALWQDVKEDLYDDDDRGSHNQILSRLLSHLVEQISIGMLQI